MKKGKQNKMVSKNTKKIYNANDIAKYFIFLASQKVIGENGEKEGITNLKLQKILYLAQAYFLAKLDRPLFKDNIEAWQYGPVIPTVYRKYKGNKSNAIIDGEDLPLILEKDKKVLKEIWNAFGGYSASRLVDITHAHTPWKDAAKLSGTKLISNKALKDYYKPLLTK